MKIFCSASKDTYITNKIIDGNKVVDDANVGRAGTLDLFRLYSETLFNGAGFQNELSRILVKFDYSKVHKLTGTKIDLNSSNFSAKLRLYDVRSGHAVPSNFNVVVFPLSQSFDEGVGRDVAAFSDIDVANFLTASFSGGTDVPWFASGANHVGFLGSDNIDIIGSGTLSGSGEASTDLFATQMFIKGTEDLNVDVTDVVSASIAGLVPHHGFRISFSGSEETDSKSRFVKRFASRHSSNPYIRPKIEVSFDDSLQDNRANFLFDVSGSLFLQNYVRSSAQEIVSGSNFTPVTGLNCMKLKLEKGRYSFITTASQHQNGTCDEASNSFVTGVYSASFIMPSNEKSLYSTTDSLSKLISDEKEVTFKEYWYSLDGTVGYHTGSITVKSIARDTVDLHNSDPEIYALNLSHEYDKDSEARIRLFAIDHAQDNNIPVKSPIKKKSSIFDKVYYRAKDSDSGLMIFDFGENDNSTRVSTDGSGMFFDFHFDVLPFGRTYTFEYLVIDKNIRKIIKDKRARFSVK